MEIEHEERILQEEKKTRGCSNSERAQHSILFIHSSPFHSIYFTSHYGELSSAYLGY